MGCPITSIAIIKLVLTLPADPITRWFPACFLPVASLFFLSSALVASSVEGHRIAALSSISAAIVRDKYCAINFSSVNCPHHIILVALVHTKVLCITVTSSDGG
jgi:hypothetical protein